MSIYLKSFAAVIFLFCVGCIDEPASPNPEENISGQTSPFGNNGPTNEQGNGPGNGGGNGGGNNENGDGNNDDENQNPESGFSLTPLLQTFVNSINLSNLPNYANQAVPNYINKDNSRSADITDEGALLGRILFYDRNLSIDNSVSCASCHRQENAFSDPLQLSRGVAGLTGRHSMRLVNVQFATENNFFWDERADDLEDQTLRPIQDHIEMGFSGQNGDPEFEDLITKLELIPYYNNLFTFVYGTPEITPLKMQDALAQFIRSIRSFDSKYDIGRSLAANNNAPFPNFTASENRGKSLFTARPNNGPNGRIGGGLGCNACHRAPEFDIDPNSRNNGVTNVAGNPGAMDFSITRSPSLRDLFDQNGNLNGPLMHTGSFNTINEVIDHYDNISNGPGNNNLDRRLRGQRLHITPQERADLTAFLKTLSGTAMYSNEKLSSPFSGN